MLDGLSKPEDIAARCKDYGYKACALTDHGSIAGCVDFFTECKKRDVKPILGCEFYICDDVKERNKKLNHVVILAKNLQGWRELIQCVSASNLRENFYHKPRIDYDMMKRYLGNGNHICISGHPGTAISESLFFSNDVFDAESYEEAKAFLKPMWKEDCRFIIDKYLEIFGDNFFLEIQLIDKDHLFAAAVIGECLREIGSELSIPTVATGDSHYVDREDAIYQRILICSSLRLKLPQVQKTLQKKGKVPLRCFFTSNNYHIPSPEDILSLHTEEEINNAGKIADMCEEYNILSSPILPHFDCPNGMEEFDYLTELCRIGWKEKLVAKGVVSTKEDKDKYTARIKEELEIIKEAGLSGYFLIVQDITNWVRSKGWLLGKGRGSAAGSLISYLIGITGIDPIPYNLLFSRFYNSSRKGSLPDIDTDVPSEHRDEVIQYIKDKYGHENVAQMVTYGRLQGRSAMKEVMSIEDALSFAEMNAITEHIPDEADISDELEEMDDKSIIKWALLNKPEKFEKWVKLVDGKLTGELADTFNKAIKLEGTYKTQSKHAAGVIIAASKLADICPMVRDSDGNPVAGFEMGNLEAIGQVKFDILGVDILSKIQKIAEHGNIDLSDMNCEEAWNLLSEGDTVGVFQLESKLGRTWAKRVKPRNLEELAALVSLIRPGTLNAFLGDKSMTQHYVDRKHGLEPVEYLHPSLEPLLKNTYGVLCIHEDSLVSLNNGEEVPIKQIEIGDIVNSIEQERYTISPQTCDDICVSPKTNGLKITLENGFSLIVTEDHELYTLRGSVEAKDLKSDDLIQFVNNQKHIPRYSNLPIYSDAKWSYLCGQLVGDGCSGMAIASGTEENHLKLLKHLQDNFSDELNVRPYFHLRSWYIGLSGKNLLNNNNHGNRKTKYRKFVELLGLDKTKNDKIVPKEIMSGAKEMRHMFLAGLFDSDGHAGEDTTHICSNNIYLLHQVRKLLSLDGISCYLTPDEKHLHITNSYKFKEIVEKYLVVKSIKNNNTGYKCGSYPRTLLKEHIDNIIKSKKMSYRKYFGGGEAGHSKSQIINPRNMKQRQFVSWGIAKNHGIDLGDITPMQIKSITPVNNARFYSISISETHNLIVNGFVVSNCYQEQAMLIAKEIAGFTEQEADNLRKAIGKKLADLMAKVKVMFLEGCKKKDVLNAEQAVKIFDWIEASNRYSFNASHGYSYGLNSYLSAMCKAKNPTKFYEVYLDHARRKADTQEEIKGLVYDARVHNIEIYPPKLGNFYKNFTTVDKNIYFGISLIKDIGEKECDKIIEAFPNTKQIKELSWIEILAFYSSKINKKAFVALISSGCFDGKNRPSRNKMLYDYDIWKENLTGREIEFIQSNIEETEGLDHHINVLINNFKLSKPRVDKLMGAKQILERPTNSLDDEISWIAQMEKNYFGVSLTCSASDMADPDIINADCKEIYQGIVKGPTNIGVTIDTIREFIIKKEGKNKGKKMAFLSVSDNTAALDSVVAFPDTYEQYKKFLYEGNTVILIGKPSEDKKDRGFIIDKVCQI